MSRRYRIWSQRSLKAIALNISLALLLWLSPGSALQPASAQLDLFDAVWQTINENFYDPNFNGVDWDAAKEQYRPLVEKASSHSEKAALINQMLGELNTSHTQFYTPDEPAYYHLLGIFVPRVPRLKSQLKSTFPEGKVEYVGIGAVTQQTDKATFVKAIFDGSPAEAAGLQVGDRILSVEGEPFSPIQSFVGREGETIRLEVQVSANPNSRKELTVTPRGYDAAEMFVEALEESAELIQKNNKQIGYVHIWSYAGEKYQRTLEDIILYGELKDADALVLDLRNGWGGAPLTALNLFTGRGPSMTTSGRARSPVTYQGQWNKPVVLLVNKGSRSAKEIVAYGFKQYDIGPVVGSKTAGFVTGGRAFIMPDESALYVAVTDVQLDGGVRLEGVGVVPDIEVPFSIEYAQGNDPQKEQAIAVALEAI